MNTGAEPMSMPRIVRKEAEIRWVSLDEIVDEDFFRMRKSEAVSSLAESLIRHGQLEPADFRRVDGGLQLLDGHRRLEAVRMLGRKRMLGRIYVDISDQDAVFISLFRDLDRLSWTIEDLKSVRDELENSGLLSPKTTALLDRAEACLSVGISDEEDSEEEEIDADELADSVRDRLADACNDLAAVYEVWNDLDEGRRSDLVACVEYLKELYPFLASTEEEDP